jgi:hypothetical protein
LEERERSPNPTAQSASLAAPGLGERSRALDAPRPIGRNGGKPPLAPELGWNSTSAGRAAPEISTHTCALRREREAGNGDRSESRLDEEAGFRHEMRRTFGRTTHFSKNEHPSFAPGSRPAGAFARRTGECRASWRFTRFGSPESA